jgi:hypothetical protein
MPLTATATARAILSATALAAALVAGVGFARAENPDGPMLAAVARHCGACHEGGDAAQGLVLVTAGGVAPAFGDPVRLERMAERIRSRSMPPADADAPLGDTDREALLNWLDERIDRSIGDLRDPGTVGIRRLTRAEYRHTIRDLLRPDLPDADADVSGFPSDDVAYGFDGIAAVNSLSPLLMERYAEVAERLGGRWAAAVLADTPATDPAAAVAHGTARLEALLDRALRRPATRTEREDAVALLTRLVAEGVSGERALAAAAARVLAAPGFLFRIERDGPIGQDRPLDGFELATRLSYFLWSTMPDEPLFATARAGGLATADEIRREVRRMLADDRVRQGLGKNFGGQWLQTRRLAQVRPDREVFPAFDESLRRSMARETAALFETVIREDRAVTDLLDADFTHVDERLARHYGIAGVTGDEFQRVSLAGLPRRGLLGHASILALNSQSTRTSPVLRGKWILDVLLNAPPPPPPPGTADLEAVGTEGTLRERMARHRSAPQCSSCHVQMDALGLALENFDGIGGWRAEEQGAPIDAAGELPGGGSFSGPVELAALLRERHASDFRRSLVEKLLIYALGRPLGVGDRRTVRSILASTVREGDRFSSIIEAIATSDPFRLRRNPGRIGVEGVPPGLEANLEGNPDQQITLTIGPDPRAEVAASPGEPQVEVHSLRRMLAAATAGGRRLPLPPAAGGGAAPWRQPLTLPAGEPVVLTFMKGMIGPDESAADFLKPVAELGPTDMSGVFDLSRTSHSWTGSLTGPSHIRPGSILAIEFDVTLVAKPSDSVQFWIATPGGTNDSMISNSGGFEVTGEGTHRLRQVGLRRTTMHDAWNERLTVVLHTRPQTLVGNLSPIRVVRPLAGLAPEGPIRLGPVAAGTPAESPERRVFNAQATTIDDQHGKPVASILYGCCRMTSDEKFQYKVATEHVGAELVGPDAAVFALVGEHAAADGRTLTFQGADGEPGLRGGPDPEAEVFRVRFRGGREPRRYNAAVRIVTQAGNLGTVSSGEAGLPTAGLSFLDIPVEATVAPETSQEASAP